MTHQPQLLNRGESGFALASVMFVGAVMVLLTAVIVMRASSQGNIEVSDARWEQSLHVAEGSLEQFLAGLAGVSDPDAVDTGHTASELGDKHAIIGVADVYAAANPDEVYVTPEGEAVILKPSDDQVMYAVGFTPSRTADGRQARVLELQYEYAAGGGAWSATTAVLMGGDLKISGNPRLEGSAGGLHGNGDLDLDGRLTTDDCVTLSGDLDGNPNMVKPGPGCPTTEGDIENNPAIPLPEMDPRDLWVKAEYQMCDNGRVRAGPAHPTMGNGGVVGSSPWDRPCRNGAPQIFNADGNEWRGWKMVGWDDKLGAKWDYTTNTAFDGSYYFYHGSPKLGTSPIDWDVMIVAESENEVGNRVGGDIEISGNPKFFPYWPDNDIVMFAERDLIISGNPHPEGVFVVKEQLKISGNPHVLGTFIVHDETDTPDSDVHSSEISGNPLITYDGSATTEWVDPGSGPAELSILKRTER